MAVGQNYPRIHKRWKKKNQKEEDYDDVDSDVLNPCSGSHKIVGWNPTPAREVLT